MDDLPNPDLSWWQDPIRIANEIERCKSFAAIGSTISAAMPTVIAALRDRAQIATLRSDLAAAVVQISDLAQAKGEAEGRLRASEMAGVVEGWREQNERLASELREAREALVQAEACMSIVEPRSDKAEYLRILGVVRTALTPDPRPSPAKGDDHGA